jgi:hypothetical protein
MPCCYGSVYGGYFVGDAGNSYCGNSGGVYGRGDIGVYGSGRRVGVIGESTYSNGVSGRTDSTYSSDAGVIGSSTNKATGVYGSSKAGFGGFFKSDADHLDLALGGSVGRINTDPDNENSNLILSSNNDVEIRLDNDGGENGVLRIASSTAYILTMDEKGILRLLSPTTGATVIEMGEGLDYAEGFDVSDKNRIVPGTVLVIDPNNPGKLTISDKPYDTKVAGIVTGANSLNSAVRLGAGQFDFDVALAGRVYANVDATYGEVSPGDLLTTSPTPGYAMVVKDYAKVQGAVLGKAMERLENGKKGQILVLVTLQ